MEMSSVFSIESIVSMWTSTIYPQLFLSPTVDVNLLYHSIAHVQISLSVTQDKREKAILYGFLSDLYRIAGQLEYSEQMIEQCILNDPKRKLWYLKRLVKKS